jgi:hypothetical protein
MTTTGAIIGARLPNNAGNRALCSTFPRLARRFLNRVHWFDSGRGHHEQTVMATDIRPDT